MEKIFKAMVAAQRAKYRFETTKGYVNMEDLWSLSRSILKDVYNELNSEYTELTKGRSVLDDDDDDVINVKQKAKETELDNKMTIVKYIFDTKKSEEKERKNEAAKKIEKAKLMDLLAKKQDAALENLSEEEILKRINELS